MEKAHFRTLKVGKGRGHSMSRGHSVGKGAQVGRE